MTDDEVTLKLIGKRVLILAGHPHAGKTGQCIDVRRTMFGKRPVVKADDGDEFFVMDPKDWRILNSAYDCPKCGRTKRHYRSKGLRCEVCD